MFQLLGTTLQLLRHADPNQNGTLPLRRESHLEWIAAGYTTPPRHPPTSRLASFSGDLCPRTSAPRRVRTLSGNSRLNSKVFAEPVQSRAFEAAPSSMSAKHGAKPMIYSP